MLKKVRIENFRSLKNVNLPLERNNVLIGPNMAGKSTICDCLRFLTQMAHGGVNMAITNLGGFAEVAWKGKTDGIIGPISICTEMDINTDDYNVKTYTYEISIIGGPPGIVSIKKEKLTAIDGPESYTLVDINNGKGLATRKDGTVVFNVSDPTKSFLEYIIPDWEGMIARKYFSYFRFYRLQPLLMKQPNVIRAESFLTETGDNFSSWYLTLLTGYPEEFKKIKQVAKDVFPALEEILVPPTQAGMTFMSTKEKYLKSPIFIQNMSDGEIVFLAWLSLIFAPSSLGAPLYCVEELENHLHPKLLEVLIEILKQRQRELGSHAAQVFITTHSPHLIDKCDIEDLIVVGKSDGETKCMRPSSKSHLRKLLESKELGLGDLWYSGALNITE